MTQAVVVNPDDVPVPVKGTVRAVVGRQTLPVTTGAVVALTPAAGAVAALIQADGAAVSVTLEGTAPAAAVGFRIDDGAFLYVDSDLTKVKMIARSANTNVQVAYFNRV